MRRTKSSPNHKLQGRTFRRFTLANSRLGIDVDRPLLGPWPRVQLRHATDSCGSLSDGPDSN